MDRVAKPKVKIMFDKYHVFPVRKFGFRTKWAHHKTNPHLEEKLDQLCLAVADLVYLPEHDLFSKFPLDSPQRYVEFLFYLIAVVVIMTLSSVLEMFSHTSSSMIMFDQSNF